MSTVPPVPRPPETSLPPRVRAGDLLAWAVGTHLPIGFQVFYVLTAIVNNVPTRQQLAPVAVNGNGMATFSQASTVTSTWLPGRYQWVCFSLDANGNRDELAQGKIVVEPDPAGTTPADPRTESEILLGNIRCLLNGKALEDAAIYKIGTRELTKMPIKDLLYWEGVIEARVRRERRGRGEFVPSNAVGIVFGGRR